MHLGTCPPACRCRRRRLPWRRRRRGWRRRRPSWRTCGRRWPRWVGLRLWGVVGDKEGHREWGREPTEARSYATGAIDVPFGCMSFFFLLPFPQVCSREEGLEALERLVEMKARELAAAEEAGAAGAGGQGRGAQQGPGHSHSHGRAGSGRRAAASATQHGAPLHSQGGAATEAGDGSGAGPSGAHGGGGVTGAGQGAVEEGRVEQLREQARVALSSQVRW